MRTFSHTHNGTPYYGSQLKTIDRLDLINSSIELGKELRREYQLGGSKAVALDMSENISRIENTNLSFSSTPIPLLQTAHKTPAARSSLAGELKRTSVEFAPPENKPIRTDGTNIFSIAKQGFPRGRFAEQGLKILIEKQKEIPRALEIARNDFAVIKSRIEKGENDKYMNLSFETVTKRLDLNQNEFNDLDIRIAATKLYVASRKATLSLQPTDVSRSSLSFSSTAGATSSNSSSPVSFSSNPNISNHLQAKLEQISAGITSQSSSAPPLVGAKESSPNLSVNSADNKGALIQTSAPGSLTAGKSLVSDSRRDVLAPMREVLKHTKNGPAKKGREI